MAKCKALTGSVVKGLKCDRLLHPASQAPGLVMVASYRITYELPYCVCALKFSPSILHCLPRTHALLVLLGLDGRSHISVGIPREKHVAESWTP